MGSHTGGIELANDICAWNSLNVKRHESFPVRIVVTTYDNDFRHLSQSFLVIVTIYHYIDQVVFLVFDGLACRQYALAALLARSKIRSQPVKVIDDLGKAGECRSITRAQFPEIIRGAIQMIVRQIT